MASRLFASTSVVYSSKIRWPRLIPVARSNFPSVPLVPLSVSPSSRLSSLAVRFASSASTVIFRPLSELIVATYDLVNCLGMSDPLQRNGFAGGFGDGVGVGDADGLVNGIGTGTVTA